MFKMKIKFSSFIVVLIAMGIFSCNKYDFNYPEGKVGTSTLVSFPVIALNGDEFEAVNQGGTYTDEGATASVAGATVDYTTNMTIDPNSPGVYTIVYTAANPQGFTASTYRTVAVIPTSAIDDPVVSAADYSGTYYRNGVPVVWTKIGVGTYTVDNPGGSTGIGKKAILTNWSGTDIDIPSQLSGDFAGTISSGGAAWIVVGTSYKMNFFAPGYGTQVRAFSK
jgi:Domain of unknown function (DUF5011)